MGIGQVVGDRRERDLRRLRELHRVREHAPRDLAEVGVAPEVRPDVQLPAHRDVVDRVVVPVQRRATGGRGEPAGVVGVEHVRADLAAGPHQVDARFERRGQRGEVRLVASAVVDERADDERPLRAEAGRDRAREGRVRRREIRVHGAVLVVREVRRQVVEQQREAGDAERADLLELGQQQPRSASDE